jgi:hypothetical protein
LASCWQQVPQQQAATMPDRCFGVPPAKGKERARPPGPHLLPPVPGPTPPTPRPRFPIVSSLYALNLATGYLLMLAVRRAAAVALPPLWGAGGRQGARGARARPPWPWRRPLPSRTFGIPPCTAH